MLDWNWVSFTIFCVLCFVFGLITRLAGIPGLYPVITGAIVGACAGSWEWFENHSGNNDY